MEIKKTISTIIIYALLQSMYHGCKDDSVSEPIPERKHGSFSTQTPTRTLDDEEDDETISTTVGYDDSDGGIDSDEDSISESEISSSEDDSSSGDDSFDLPSDDGFNPPDVPVIKPEIPLRRNVIKPLPILRNIPIRPGKPIGIDDIRHPALPLDNGHRNVRDNSLPIIEEVDDTDSS
jgi:hypothetical protein